MKKYIALLILATTVAVFSCTKGEDDDNSGVAMLLLSGGTTVPLVGTWAEPSASSSTKGSCQWLNTPSGDMCNNNYTESACEALPDTIAGTSVIFSTSTGSTSLDTANNLCTQNGYTDCRLMTGPFVMCGPNQVR